jgi:SAM-dependent methyltransferase
MSTFVWMKVLESAPERYDRGIRMLSAGRIQQVYDCIAVLAAAPGKRVLDIGCGTGAVSLVCAARGAVVTGIDIDAGMLEVARAKPVSAVGSAAFIELGAAEIEDRFAPESFDAIVSCLALSELSPDEDYDLFILGTVALAAASVGYCARRIRWRGWAAYHITGMGSSYIVLLTAFYVDNGPKLPLWNLLPTIAFWILPSLLGLPLMFFALYRYSDLFSAAGRRASVRLGRTNSRP